MSPLPTGQFGEQLYRSREKAEQPIDAWFQHHGLHVLPAYRSLSGGDTFPPAIESAAGSISTPDFQVFDGVAPPYWVEVKYKTRADYTRYLNRYDTGLDAHHWEHYNHLHLVSYGAEVFIVFAHEEEDTVTFDAMTRLCRPCSFQREGKDRGHDMIYWHLEELTHAGKLSAIRAGKYPPLPKVLQPAARRERWRALLKKQQLL